MPDSEAQPLLDKLFAVMMDERFHYRHHWQDQDLVIWDNRCLNHQACGGYSTIHIRTNRPPTRVLQRVTSSDRRPTPRRR